MEGKFDDIHRNSKDLIQKLLLFNLPKDTRPLEILGYKTGKIVGVEPTDIVSVRTRDDAADVLFRLEENVILHIEMQTNYKRNDIYRFAEYDAYLLSKYKNEEITIETVVIFTHNVNKDKVFHTINKGSLNYHFTPIFLQGKAGDDYLKAIKEKIQLNPDCLLTPEEQLLLIYIPLMDTKESLNDCVLDVTKTVSNLNDERQKFNIIGTLLAFHHKKLEPDVSSKLWEVLQMGGAVFEEFTREVVDKAFHEGEKKKAIDAAEKMIRKGTSDEDIMEFLDLSKIELNAVKKRVGQNE